MNIDKIKSRVADCKGKTLNFRFNGSRNQTEEFSGKIVEIYDYIFIVSIIDKKTNVKNSYKSFSYSDVLIKKLVVLNY